MPALKYYHLIIRIDTLTETIDVPKRRIESLDLLRGAAIIGVITVHILLGAGRNVDSTSNGFNIAELAYAGLPMFIIISGYLHKCGKSYKWNIINRVVPLMVVLVVATIAFTSLMYGYMYLLGYDLSQYDLLSDIWTILIGKGVFTTISSDTFSAGHILSPYDISAGFYYLQILAVGYLIFYAIADPLLKDWRKTVAAIAGLVCFTALYLATIDIQLPFSAQLGPIVAAFLLTGALLRNYDVAIYLETGFHEFRYWAIFITAVILGAVMIIMFPTGMKMYNSYFGAYGPWSVFTFYLFAIFCGTVLWYIAVFLIKVPIVSDVFEFAGISSLVFYTLHMFIAKLITAPFVTIGTDFWITVNADNQRFLVLMLTLIILSLLTIALNRMKGTLKEENIDTDSVPSSH